MQRKPQIKATLPDHIIFEIDRYSNPLEITRAEYLAAIAKWWYAKGCPPLTEHEEQFRKKHGARRAS